MNPSLDLFHLLHRVDAGQPEALSEAEGMHTLTKGLFVKVGQEN